MQKILNFSENIEQPKTKKGKSRSGKKYSKRSNDKKFRKEQKRKKKKLKKASREVPSNYQLRHLSYKSYSNFIRFLNKNIEHDETPSNSINVPKKLSFVINFENTISFFKNLHNALYKSKDNLSINFKNCKHISLGSATYMQVMIIEYLEFQNKFNQTNYSKINKNLSITKSKTTNTNKMLYACRIISSMDDNDDIELSTYLAMNLMTISKLRSSYKENKKGKACADVIKFVNESIKGSGFELDEQGENNMDNLMSEILGNAEDHSLLNQYFVNGVSFKENDDDGIVELNLVILNLGDSIYEGFQKTKDQNKKINSQMENLFDIHMKILNGKFDNNYSKESLFTLYALQEGVSRLKFKEQSRGNGTMNFIRAFMNLGAFGEDDSNYESKLNVISGHTVIECPNKYKPHLNGTLYQLSLNDKNNIKELPDRKCIFVNKEYFPGTILQVKIYMCKKYFMKILSEDE